MKKIFLLYLVLLLSFTIAGMIGCGGNEEKETGAPLAISQMYPSNGAINVPTTAMIRVTFNQGVNPPSNSNFSFSPAASGNVTYDSTTSTMVFKPSTPLKDYTDYTVEVKNVTNMSGNKMSPVTVKYKTSVADNTAPEIEFSSPEDGQIGFGFSDNIKIRFSEPIDKTKFWNALSIYPSIDLDKGKWFVKWSELDEREVMIMPPPGQKTFDVDTEYTLKLANDKITDLSGNALVTDFRATFETLRYLPETMKKEDYSFFSLVSVPKEPPFMYVVGKVGTDKWVIGWGGSAPKDVSIPSSSGTISASGDGEIGSSIEKVVGHGGDPITVNISKGRGNSLSFSSEAIGAGVLSKWFKVMFTCDASYLTFNLSMNNVKYINLGEKGTHPSRTPFILSSN